MSSFYKKAVVWLGLNEEYPEDDHRELPHREPSRRAPQERRGPEVRERPVGPSPAPVRSGAAVQTPRPAADRGSSEVRAVPMSGAPTQSEVDAVSEPRVSRPSNRPAGALPEGAVRAIPMEDPPEASAIGTVRPVAGPTTRRPNVVIPKSFNDAQEVGDLFKDAQPVIVNLENAERDLARRLIDFASGLCYGLGGQMEKVAKDVYLLTPTDVSVSEEDRRQYTS